MRIGQVWVDAEGWRWRVANVHRRDVRADGTVELICERGYRIRVYGITFGELAHHYELEEGDR